MKNRSPKLNTIEVFGKHIQPETSPGRVSQLHDTMTQTKKQTSTFDRERDSDDNRYDSRLLHKSGIALLYSLFSCDGLDDKLIE